MCMAGYIHWYMYIYISATTPYTTSERSQIRTTKAERGMQNLREEHEPLYKWNSCAEHLKPPKTMSRSQVKRIHIYDFDNTLFKSPAPNPNLLSKYMVNILTDPQKLSNGGWWSEPRFLQELIKEWAIRRSRISSVDKQALEALDHEYWNKDIVELSYLSQIEPGTISVLMTGRKEVFFHDVIGKVLDNPVFGYADLQFHAVFLKKPNYETTMKYKTSCITELLDHYDQVEEITLYDDRIRQLDGFQKFLNEYVEAIRPNLQYNLVHVPGIIKYLDPRHERRIIGDIVEEHNFDVDCKRHGKPTLRRQNTPSNFDMTKMGIRERRLGASYMLTGLSCKKVVQFTLKEYICVLGGEEQLNTIHFHPRSIMATQKGCTTTKLEAAKIIMGCDKELSEDVVDACVYEMNHGIEDSKVQWKLTEFGHYNKTLFVFKVEPVPKSRYVYTEFPYPLLVVGTKDGFSTEISEIYNIGEFRWLPVREDIFIDTYFGYDFRICDVHKRTKKKRWASSRY